MDYTQIISEIAKKLNKVKDIISSSGRKIFRMLAESSSELSASGKKLINRASESASNFKAKAKAFKEAVISFLCAAGVALAFFTALVLFFYTLMMSFGNKKKK